ELIEETDVTYEQVADDTGLHESYVLALVSGAKEPSAEVVERLARYFEVPPETFLADPSAETLGEKASADTLGDDPAAPRPKQLRAFSRVFLGDMLSEEEHARWVRDVYDERLEPQRVIALIRERVTRSSAVEKDKEVVLRFLARDWQ